MADPLEYPWLKSTRETLLGGIDTHHCLLLSGGPGIGKAALALELAQRLLCEEARGEAGEGRQPPADGRLRRQTLRPQGCRPSLYYRAFSAGI